MAIKWTLAQATNAIKNGDLVSVSDFGKKAPIATHMLTLAIGEGSETLNILLNAIPEYVTMSKLEGIFKKQIEEGTVGEYTKTLTDESFAEEDDAEEEKEQQEAKEPDVKKVEVAGDKPKKRGRPPKAVAVDVVEEKKEEQITVDDFFKDDEEAEEKETNEEALNYYDMKAKDLYMICKKRKIKCEPKKKASFYIELLLESDKKNSDQEDLDLSLIHI